MSNGFPPRDWFPWTETWPSWMPNAPRDGEFETPAPLDIGTGGLLGHLLAPRDPSPGGLLGNLGTARDSGGGGLLGNLGARRGGGNGGLLGHLFEPPAGPPLFDRGPEIAASGCGVGRSCPFHLRCRRQTGPLHCLRQRRRPITGSKMSPFCRIEAASIGWRLRMAGCWRCTRTATMSIGWRRRAADYWRCPSRQ